MEHLETTAFLTAIAAAAVFAIRQIVKLLAKLDANTKRKLFACAVVGARYAYREFVQTAKHNANREHRRLNEEERKIARKIALDGATTEAGARHLSAWLRLTPETQQSLIDSAIEQCKNGKIKEPTP